MFQYINIKVVDFLLIKLLKGIPTMKNLEIREAIKKSRFMQYEIAQQIGISEFSLCRWFRQELTAEQKEKILTAIEQLKAGATDDK